MKNKKPKFIRNKTNNWHENIQVSIGGKKIEDIVPVEFIDETIVPPISAN